MSVRKALWSCAIASVCLAGLALAPLPRYLPLLNSRVRHTVVLAMDELRTQGYWLTNMELVKTEITADEVCFTWEYRYKNRTTQYSPEYVRTCHDA